MNYFNFFLINLQKKFDKNYLTVKDDFEILDEKISDSKLKRLICSDKIKSKTFIQYFFEEINFENYELDFKEIKIWEKSDKKIFLSNFILNLNQNTQINSVIKTIIKMKTFFLPKIKMEIINEINILNIDLQTKFDKGEGKFSGDLRNILQHFPREESKTNEQINKDFVKLVSEFENIDNKDNAFTLLISKQIKSKSDSFNKKINKIIQNGITAEDQDKDVYIINDFRIIINFLFMLKDKSNFKKFIRDGYFLKNDINQQEIIDKVKNIKNNLNRIHSILANDSRQKMKDKTEKRTKSIVNEIDDIMKNYKIKYIINLNLHKVHFEINNQKTKIVLDFNYLIEIKNKTEIFEKLKLAEESKLDKLKKFNNCLTIIFAYRDTIMKCLENGIIPEDDFLIPLSFESVFIPSQEMRQKLDILNKKSFKVTPAIKKMKSLTEKKVYMETLLSQHESDRKNHFEKTNFSIYHYLTNFFFGKKSIGLNEKKLCHWLRKLNPDSTLEEYSQMIQSFKGNIFKNKNDKIVDKLKNFFKENIDHFKTNLFEQKLVEDQKKLDESSLNYILYQTKTVTSEWTAIGQFCLAFLSGETPPASKIFFCFLDTSFKDIEPFIYNSTSTEKGLPHFIIGFSNLNSNIQKKTLDLFKKRFEEQSKIGYVVLFLNDEKEITHSLIYNFRTCLKKTVFEDHEVNDLNNFSNSSEKVKGNNLRTNF